MKLLIVLTILVLVNLTVSKENVIYEAKGAELIDILRGRPPKEGALKLTKVEGDRGILPDGIYFEPEDDALTSPEENKYLYLNANNKKLDDSDKKPDSVSGKDVI